MTIETLDLSRRLMLGAGVILAASCTAKEEAMPKASAGPTLTGRAPFDGIEVYYEVHGGALKGAVPYVLLHGGLLAIETAFAGKALLRLMAEKRPVIAIDMEGHGHTAPRGTSFTFEGLAAGVAAVLDHLDVAKAHVVGHSLGGLTALALAIHHPDKVASCAPISANRVMDGYLPELVKLQRDPTHVPSAELIPLLPTEQAFAAWTAHYKKVNPKPETFDAVSAGLNQLLTTWKGYSEAQFKEIAAPTLVIIGDNDFIRIEHAAEMKALIPDAQLYVLPGTTHMNIIDKGELLAPMIEANAARAA